MPVKTRKMMMTVISARTPTRVFALSKLRSVTPAKVARLSRSWVKACTVCTDKSASEALPDEAAIQSWFSRLRRRRRRPSTRIGTSTSGTSSSTRPVSLAEVRSISTSPPTRISALRSAMETDEPITDRISVVSVVIRLSTSPVMICSKKAGLMPMVRSKTDLRMSATTRSPRSVTR